MGFTFLVYCQNRVAAMPKARTAETPNSAWSTSLRPTRRCSRLGSSAQKIAISPTERTRKGQASVVSGVPVMNSRTLVAQSACVAILANPSRDIQQSVAYEALPSDRGSRVLLCQTCRPMRRLSRLFASRYETGNFPPKRSHSSRLAPEKSRSSPHRPNMLKCSSSACASDQ
jgi:hypothetical protein